MVVQGGPGWSWVVQGGPGLIQAGPRWTREIRRGFQGPHCTLLTLPLIYSRSQLTTLELCLPELPVCVFVCLCVCVSVRVRESDTLASGVHAAEGSAQLLGLDAACRRQLTAPLQHQQQGRTVLLGV